MERKVEKEREKTKKRGSEREKGGFI